MFSGLRSSDGKIYASVAFVRIVNIVVWTCVFPFASPIAFYMAGMLPVWFQKAALVTGTVLIVSVPLAAPQTARPQVTPEDISRLERTDEKLFNAQERTRTLQEAQHQMLQTHLEVDEMKQKHQDDAIARNTAVVEMISGKMDRATWMFMGGTVFLGVLIRYRELASFVKYLGNGKTS